MNISKAMHRILSVVLVLCLVLGMLPMMAMAAEEEPKPDDSDWLQEKIDNAANDGFIDIDHNLVLSRTVSIPAGKNLTIRGKDAKMYEIKAASQFTGDSLFKVPGGDVVTHATFYCLTLDGNDAVRGIYAGANTWLVLGRSRLEGEDPQLIIQNCRRSGASQHGAGLWKTRGRFFCLDTFLNI